MCHPSHTPGGCGHGVGVDLSQADNKTWKAGKVNSKTLQIQLHTI